MTLGSFLKVRRKQAGLTARALIERAALSISTPLLSQWESDTRFPAPEHLEKIAEALNIPLKTIFFLWAQTQMPSEKLKQIFHYTSNADLASRTVRGSTGDPKAFPASQTLVLANRDAQWFNRHPLALTLLSRALFASLQGGDRRRKALNQGLKLSAREGAKLLEGLVKLKYLMKEGKDYFTPPGICHLYPPHSDDFEPVRRARMSFLFDSVCSHLSPSQLIDNPGFRQVIGRPLSAEQVNRLKDKLEAILMELVEAPMEKQEPQARNYWFVAALGPLE